MRCILILFLSIHLHCLNAERSIFDFSTPKGLGYFAVLQSLLSSTASSPPVYPVLPDTGQTTCFNASATIACTDGSLSSFPKQDGLVSKTFSFTEVDSGASLKDSKTSLIWTRCLSGESWNGSSCINSASTATQPTAAASCSSLSTGGRTWRLPTIREIIMLANYEPGASGLHSMFNANLSSRVVWSTTEGSIAGNYYIYTFSDGSSWILTLSSSANTDLNNFICVSGENNPQSLKDNGDFTITDYSTSLIWMKCNVGETTPDCIGNVSYADWNQGLSECSNSNFAGRSWRLPDIKELLSLFDYNIKISNRINTSFMNRAGSTGTSTTAKSSNSSLMRVAINGGISTSPKTLGNLYYRCVSDL